MVSTNESSKFKLDCVEAKKVYILLTDVINFKLRLINFVHQKFDDNTVKENITMKSSNYSRNDKDKDFELFYGKNHRKLPITDEKLIQ